MADLEGRSAPDAYGVDTDQETPKTCPGCGVAAGTRHDHGCDVSRCPECGEQAVQCGDHLEAGESTWTGEWPGDVECREWGWWTETTLYPSGAKKVVEDLNRLAIAAARREVYWDKTTERYHRPPRSGPEA